jgi:hypothetical protein
MELMTSTPQKKMLRYMLRYDAFVNMHNSTKTHSPGTNSTKAMAAMLVFQTLGVY